MNQGDFLRPLSIHQGTKISFEFFDSPWVVHAIIQYGVRNKTYSYGDRWGYEGITYNWGRNLPVVNDEYGYIGETQKRKPKHSALTRTKHRQIMWGIYMAGGYGTTGDYNHYGNIQPFRAGVWRKTAEYEDIKHLVDFFTTKGIEYWQSFGRSLLSAENRVYVMANPGKLYVFYAAQGGEFAAQIAPGTYVAHRYDPRTGEDTVVGNVTGGLQSLTTPDRKDWVVYLKSK